MHRFMGISWELISVSFFPSSSFKFFPPFLCFSITTTTTTTSPSSSSCCIKMVALPTLSHRLPTSVPGVLQSSSFPISPGTWSIGTRSIRENVRLLCSKCNTMSKPQAQLHMIECEQMIEHENIQQVLHKFPGYNEVTGRIEIIKAMLNSMKDGEISISAYDTAWVALVQDIHGSGAPQFPSSLQWIIENQLQDGSWGDRYIFSAHDRLINTLACVIALKAWNIYPGRREKALSFIRKNISKLKDENTTHMPIGFEVVFPSLIEIARKLDIEVPDQNSPALQDVYAKRNIKLERIPKEMMHIVPTTLLHSLEGMGGLDWKKLLKLQSKDGSFLFSPSSTAFALMETKDEKCLEYLKKAVERFKGGVPNVYPIDLFEHIWAVDRLERLGISRYFESEIKECLNYVYRYWTENGVCWARNSRVNDSDDTSMGFRLLRLHGHAVSADAFRHFEKDGEFFCFPGQSSESVTCMFNLYRASQLSFPGEKILQEAKSYSSKFLRKKRNSSQLLDKWIITKDLPGEVGYALDVPWYANLPRIETRFYIEQYGGENDVWIGKTLYRMPYVNNNIYLELAKLDYNNCQELHQLEWIDIQKWYTECNLGMFGVDRKTMLQAFFLATSSIFEPERSPERIAWTKTAVLIEAVLSFFRTCSVNERKGFIQDFISSRGNMEINSCYNISSSRRSSSSRTWSSIGSEKRTRTELMEALVCTLNHLSLDALVAHGRDVRHQLRCSWEIFLQTREDDDNDDEEEEDDNNNEANLVVRTILMCAGRSLSEEILSHSEYKRLLRLTSTICLRLHHLKTQESKQIHKMGINGLNKEEEEDRDMISIESDMQELVQCVLQSSSSGGIDPEIKKTFLMVTKSYFYSAYCSPKTIDSHISKVLFERVD